MSIYIPDEKEIYFPKTREYFQEVLSSYANKNYRSAVVMLYSVAICDILFKLQELQDMYNDKTAKSILDEIDKCRSDNDNKSKSSWEKELIEKIHNDTKLLSLEAYTNLIHLRDHRNFSAHPALNSDYELIAPSQETTIAHINNILKDILIKPPIFIKDIFHSLVEDISKKKDIYENDKDKLEVFLNNKYFSRMPNSMKNKVYITLWKFCFCKPEDDNCIKNQKINRLALEILSNDMALDISNIIENNKNKCVVSEKIECIEELILYLCEFPYIYKSLSTEVTDHLDSYSFKNMTANVLSWFKFPDLQNHLEHIKSLNIDYINKFAIKKMYYYYENQGYKEDLLDHFVYLYGKVDCFDKADYVFQKYISSYLSKMSKAQVKKLIDVSSNNDQIYGRRSAYSSNSEIITMCKDILGKDFDYDNISSNFKFDTNILKDSEKVENIIDDENELFIF